MIHVAESLSDLDRAIVRVLQRNCRVPATKIGEELGIAASRVSARIQSMFDLGVIRFTAQRNLRAYGYQAFSIIDITLNGKQCVSAIEAVCELPNAIIVAEMLGAPHLYVFAVAKTQRDMARFVTTDLAAIDNIKLCQAHSVMGVVQFATGVGGLEPHTELWSPGTDESMDELIIDRLQFDARSSNSEISRHLGVSEASVRQRISKMVAEDKIRFGLLVDQQFLTVNNIRVDIAATPARVRAITDKVAKIAPWVMVVDGEYQISMAIQNPDITWIANYVRDEIEGLPGVLSTRTSPILKTIKHNYNCIVIPSRP